MTKVFFHHGLEATSNFATAVLAATDPGDVVILPETAKPYLPWAMSHYQSIGLPCAAEVVFGGYEMIGQYPNHELSVHLFNQEIDKARKDLARLRATNFLWSKNNFLKLCQSQGVETPATRFYTGRDNYKRTGLKNEPLPVIVKTATSAAGLKVWQCTDELTFRQIIAGLDGSFQIQQVLPEGTVFFSVQYQETRGKLYHGPITQKAGKENCRHSYPASCCEELIYRVTDKLAELARRQGLKDCWSYGVAVTPEKEVLLTGCHPSWSEASYYSAVAKKLEVKAWQSFQLDIGCRSYDGVRLGELAYDRRSGTGIVVVDWAGIASGKLGVLVAGSSRVQLDYLNELTYRCR